MLNVKIGQTIRQLRDLVLQCNDLEDMLVEQVADLSQRFVKPDN